MYEMLNIFYLFYIPVAAFFLIISCKGWGMELRYKEVQRGNDKERVVQCGLDTDTDRKDEEGIP